MGAAATGGVERRVYCYKLINTAPCDNAELCCSAPTTKLTEVALTVSESSCCEPAAAPRRAARLPPAAACLANAHAPMYCPKPHAGGASCVSLLSLRPSEFKRISPQIYATLESGTTTKKASARRLKTVAGTDKFYGAGLFFKMTLPTGITLPS